MAPPVYFRITFVIQDYGYTLECSNINILLITYILDNVMSIQPHRNLEEFRSQTRWHGWQTFKNIFRRCDNSDQMRVLLSIFVLGCRVSELKSLQPEYVSVNGEYVEISHLLVLKQRDRLPLLNADGSAFLDEDTGKAQYYSKPKTVYRNFKFPLLEPTSRAFLKQVDKANKGEPVFDYSSNQCFYRLATIGLKKERGKELKEWSSSLSDIYPHYLRGLRASCLVNEYKNFRHLTVLKDWFKWKSSETPSLYLSMNLESQNIEKDEMDKLKGMDTIS